MKNESLITEEEFDTANRRAKTDIKRTAIPAFWNFVKAADGASDAVDSFDLRGDDPIMRGKFGLLQREAALDALALVRYIVRYEFELEIELLEKIDES